MQYVLDYIVYGLIAFGGLSIVYGGQFTKPEAAWRSRFFFMLLWFSVWPACIVAGFMIVCSWLFLWMFPGDGMEFRVRESRQERQ